MARTPDGLEVPEARAAQPDLTERLDRLPHGHPSSPYEADGTPKPPVTLPRETPTPREAAVPRDAPAPPETPPSESAPDREAAVPRESAPGQGAAAPREASAVRRDAAAPRETASPPQEPAARREAITVPGEKHTHETPLPAEARVREEPHGDSRASAGAGSEARELPDSRKRPEPFTDAQWADHIRNIREDLHAARADGMATDDQHTLDTRREVWSKERRAAHTAIINDMYEKAAYVPNEHRAIIAGGLPGAGKTTILEHYAGIDRSHFLTINPDDVKVELARRNLIPDIKGLSPMEASELAHEESSYIAKRLAFRAQADGKNLIWDITMSSLPSTQARIQDLRDNGYEDIQGIFVDLPPEVSARRADRRHREDEDKYRSGTGGGGRFIPAEGILANQDATWGSTNRKTFEAVKARLDGWKLYDNSVDGSKPTLVESSSVKEVNT